MSCNGSPQIVFVQSPFGTLILVFVFVLIEISVVEALYWGSTSFAEMVRRPRVPVPHDAVRRDEIECGSLGMDT